MTTTSERCKPWLTAFLAIVLAAPGIPTYGQPPHKDALLVDVIVPRQARIGARDALGVDVPVMGRDHRPLPNLLVRLILPSLGGPGLVSDTGQRVLDARTGADGHARFDNLRANEFAGRFRIVVMVTGPNGEMVEKERTLRNVEGYVFLGLSVKQLVSIAAGGAVAGGLGYYGLGRKSSSPPPTTIALGGSTVTTGRKPRR
jgi:hypothetical protein